MNQCIISLVAEERKCKRDNFLLKSDEDMVK